MSDFSEMPEEVQEAFKRLMAGHDCKDHDEKNSVQVGILSGPLLTRWKKLQADRDRLHSRYTVLNAKVEAVNSRMKVLHTETWNAIYEALQISSDGSYTITKDNRVMRLMKKGDE